jgi:hypothetical protein
VSLTGLKAALLAYMAAFNEAAGGTKQAVSAKNDARLVLEGLLRQEAAYVQSIAGDSLTVLLTSGFDAASNNKASMQLAKPVIALIENEATTQLKVRLQAVDNARAYEVRMSYGANGWQAVGTFTDSRRILVENLTPGTVYSVQARAVGGSTGYSDWSDPVSKMAT